jgi:hypothetical protein
MNNDDWDLKQSLKVFEGSFTCCAIGHPKGMTCDKWRIVDPLLGIYCRSEYAKLKRPKLETRTSAQLSTLSAIFQNERSTIFPDKFFGDLIDVADRTLDQEPDRRTFSAKVLSNPIGFVVGQESLKRKTGHASSSSPAAPAAQGAFADPIKV